MKTTCVLLVLLAMGMTQNARSADPEAQSLLAAVEVNAGAIESLDLLVESSTFSDSDEDAESIQSIERIVIDKKSDIAAYFRQARPLFARLNVKENNSPNGNLRGSNEQRAAKYEAWLFTQGKLVHRPFPLPPMMPPDIKSLEGFLNAARCLNIKLVGSMPLAECRRWGTSDIRQRRLMALASLKNARAPEPTVQVELPLKNYTSIFEWEFPETKLTPRMISMFVKSGAHVSRNYNEIIRWEEINGIAVPVLIEIDQVVAETDSAGQLFIKQVQHEYKFHWLALNNNIETESLDESKIQSLEEVMKMTDVTAYRDKVITKK